MSISTAAYCYANKATKEKRAKIIATVRENPEITGAELIRQYHKPTCSRDSQKRTRAMLQNLCADGQLKWLDGDRYIVPPAQ
jgi:hypothetical protein